MIGRVLGGAIVLVIVRRQSLPKLMTNLSMFAAEAAVTCLVFRSLVGDASPTEVRAWLAFTLAMLSSHVLGVIVVSAGITILSGWAGSRMLRQVAIDRKSTRMNSS